MIGKARSPYRVLTVSHDERRLARFRLLPPAAQFLRFWTGWHESDNFLHSEAILTTEGEAAPNIWPILLAAFDDLTFYNTPPRGGG